MENLFFTFYSDRSGWSWTFWVYLICFILLPVIIYLIKKCKAKDLRICTISIICISVLFFYQLIPATLNSIAMITMNENLINAAIKTSVIPYQKGAYYCNLSVIMLKNRHFNGVRSTYNNAYKYLKTYECPCWGLAWLCYKTFGDYDTAIEIINESKDSAKWSSALTTLYILKEDYTTALKYADMLITEHPDSFHAYAKRGFIHNKLKRKILAQKDLKKALSLCKTKEQVTKTFNIYKNFRNIELKREAEIRRKWQVN